MTVLVSLDVRALGVSKTGKNFMGAPAVVVATTAALASGASLGLATRRDWQIDTPRL